MVTQAGDDDLVMFFKNYVKLGEDGDAVVIETFSVDMREPVMMPLKTWADSLWEKVF